ncbi:MAG: prepilin-type N-terminal cleavage/methylation domain-containing protein [Verrucomicrobiota bacterium]
MKTHRKGFTLVELLVTFVVIATLGGLGLACIQNVRKRARSVVEINAARNLITGYLGYAAENSGLLLKGFDNQGSATNLEGKSVGFPASARYPWRLAPSVPKVEGVLLYNGNESALKGSNSDYMVSVSSNMGINATLVGGYYHSAAPMDASKTRLIDTYGKFFVSNLSEANNPGSLIVFASARGGREMGGYYEVRPPNLTGPVWSRGKFEESNPGLDHGYVDFRWGGKAVVAMLGGNVELLDEERLRDMRRWSNQASVADDPDYLITRQ